MATKDLDPSRVSSFSSASDHKTREVIGAEEKSRTNMQTGENESPVDRVQEVIEEAKHEDSAQNDDGEEEDASQYPTSWKLLVIIVALCLAVFCMALDNTIIATAIPRITDDFHALDDVAWYGSAYLLFTCSFQLFFGKLYTFYSIKWVYLSAIAIFELGSLVCGVAPTSDALIIGRCIAGLGAAGVFSGSILVVAHTVPLRKRPVYTGFMGAMYGLASVAGPLMGGAFTDHLSWRWCFYINLPFGFVTIVFIFFFLKLPPSSKTLVLTWREKVARLDLFGTGVFIPGIVCLLLALQWGGSKYPWSDGRIIALFVVFGVLIIAFLGIQYWKQEFATVPPRIFFQRSIWAAASFATCLGGSFFLLVYYIPIWFQAVKGTSAVHSGINSIPLVLSVTVFSIISGIGVTVLGRYKIWVVASSVFMAVGCGLLTTLQVHSNSGHWIGFQIIAGAGFGMGIQNPLIAVQTVLALKDVPTGTAIIMFSQTLGGALFIAVGQNVFLNQLLSNVRAIVPDFPAEIVLRTGATTLVKVIPPKYLAGVLYAYNKTVTHTFYVSTALGALSIVGALVLENKSVKGKKMVAAAA